MNPLLLIEDDENDALFFERALAEAGGGVPLRIARDVEAARASLLAAPRPSLVVLDLALRGESGLEVLEWMRRQPALKEIPVVVLASSPLPAELDRALKLGVERVDLKPSALPDLRAVVKAIRDRWREFGNADPRPSGETCRHPPPKSGRSSADA